VDWKLEVIVVPVADVDRAKDFYVDQVGFEVQVDYSAGEDFRVVHLIPRGSACAVALMKNTESAGSLSGMHLVVSDIEAARDEVVGRGVAASEFYHFSQGGQQPGLEPDRADYGSYFSFSDPDGNEWLVQEVGRSAS
jgi:catechol 2,3-dioxygenase-like lactoylglutathione lyase family enzyme